MTDELLLSIAAKKERLDELRPLSARALAQLDHFYDVELTYTSNAIEGNTLTAVETTLVIEKGITVGGKPLKDHLELSTITTLFVTFASWPAKARRFNAMLPAQILAGQSRPKPGIHGQRQNFQRPLLDLRLDSVVGGLAAQSVQNRFIPVFLQRPEQPLHLPHAQPKFIRRGALRYQLLLRLLQRHQPVTLGLGHQ